MSGPTTQEKCTQCGGRGRVHYEVSGDIEQDQRTYLCPACGGDGVLPITVIRTRGAHPDTGWQNRNHYDWFMPDPAALIDDQWLDATEAKMTEALTDPFVHDMAQVVLPLLAEVRRLRARNRKLTEALRADQHEGIEPPRKWEFMRRLIKQVDRLEAERDELRAMRQKAVHVAGVERDGRERAEARNAKLTEALRDTTRVLHTVGGHPGTMMVEDCHMAICRGISALLREQEAK
jgi:hypothetical protein